MSADSLRNFFFAVVIIVILASVGLTLWKTYKAKENEARCPNCRAFWAAQKINDELIGIFRKNKEYGGGPDDPPEHKMVRYEKYKIYCKCKYCGHEWTFFESREQ